MQNRAHLRKRFRAKRNQISAADRNAAATQLKQQLSNLPLLQHANHIAAYMATDGEIDPLPWVIWAQHHQKNCYLPVINQTERVLLFGHYGLQSLMQKNQFGILEPIVDQGALFLAKQLDIIFVPIVVFDLAGHRLGRGGGYYDRTFAYKHEKQNHEMHKQNESASSSMNKPLLIGLAYEFQRVEQITAEQWDVKLDGVVTEQLFYDMRNIT